MLQLKIPDAAAKTKDPVAETKTRHSQIINIVSNNKIIIVPAKSLLYAL